MKSTLNMVLLSQNFLFFARITSWTFSGIYGMSAACCDCFGLTRELA